MKTLVVVHGFPPSGQGGAEIYAHALARGLHETYGDDVLVLTREQDRGRPDYDIRTEHRDGLRIVWVNNLFRATRSFEETYRNRAIGAIAERVIDEFRPDVAHVHHLTCLSTTIVESLANRAIPCVLTLHDYWLMCHRGQLLDVNLEACSGPEKGCEACLGVAGSSGRVGFAGAAAVRAIERRLEVPILRRAAESVAAAIGRNDVAGQESAKRLRHMREICGRVTQFVAPAHAIRDRFVQFGIEPHRIIVSPYGIDRELFTQITRAASSSPSAPPAVIAGTADAPLRIGFLGSLMVSKGPRLLLEAAAILPADRIAVELFGDHVAYHGDTSYRGALESFMDRPNVAFRGPLPHEQVPQALASLDALVVPSIWPEASPLVIHEAFCAGVPVVAARIGGIPELVEEGRNGLLFTPGDAADLASALARLLEERGLLDRLRRGLAPPRTLEDDVRRTRAMYEELVNRHAVPMSPARPLSRLAAVVLNYRTPDDTLLTVSSLLASDRPIDDLIVVDNGDGRDLGEALGELGRRVHCEPTGANRGFSAGMNAGIRIALDRGADRVLLVNSDVIVPPDCVAQLERALDEAPRAGIVGPVVASRGRPDLIASRGIAYDSTTGRMRLLDAGRSVDAVPSNSLTAVDALAGCVMLVKKEVFDAAGLLHEDFFFGFEDVDLCLRARAAGFTSVVAGGALVFHEGGRSIGSQSARRLYFAARNHLLMASRCRAPASAGWRVSRASLIVAFNLAHAFRATGASLPARLRAVARGTVDYARGRFGPADSET
jgi:GT2 family glycosyltransferase/glycosyltransferase involved in cell wall biosynthesis